MNIIDLNAFSDEMDNDDDAVGMILTEIINAIEYQIPEMKILIEDHEYDTLSREAHSIKGGARNIMAEGLEMASTDIETAAKSHDNDTLLTAYSSLISEFKRFKEYIINYYPLIKLA